MSKRQSRADAYHTSFKEILDALMEDHDRILTLKNGAGSIEEMEGYTTTLKTISTAIYHMQEAIRAYQKVQALTEAYQKIVTVEGSDE